MITQENGRVKKYLLEKIWLYLQWQFFIFGIFRMKIFKSPIFLKIGLFLIWVLLWFNLKICNCRHKISTGICLGIFQEGQIKLKNIFQILLKSQKNWNIDSNFVAFTEWINFKSMNEMPFQIWNVFSSIKTYPYNLRLHILHIRNNIHIHSLGWM